MRDDGVDDAVRLCLLGRHEVVAVEVALDLLDRTAGVPRHQPVDRAAEVEDLLRLDLDLARRAAAALLRRLVLHDARMGQRAALPLASSGKEEASHARG